MRRSELYNYFFLFDQKNQNCFKKKGKTFSNRLKNYPFNRYSRIEFVSFQNSLPGNNEFVKTPIDSLPLINDTVCYSKLKEVKILTHHDVDKLTDILYNYGYGGRIYSMTVSQCFIPRNAIVFTDSTGTVYEYIEICFECNRLRLSSDKIDVGELCNQKIEMLEFLFSKVGIKYGVKEGL